MRIGRTLRLGLLAFGAVGTLWLGCSEEKPVGGDQTAPYVEIIHPVSLDREGWQVRDTTTIIVAASDDGGVASVEIFCHVQGDTATKRIAALTEPDSTGNYSAFWETAGIQNGSGALLRARAVDRAGNEAVSADARVQVINTEEIGPPRANFLMLPSEGTVQTEFCFDATLTEDDLAEPQMLFVQWDFQGDGIWDVTLDERRNVNEQICHRYPVPDTYMVALEVYNEYYSIPLDIPGTRQRRLIVRPAHGDPRPPEGQEFVLVSAGEYPLGVVDCAPGDSCDNFDLDETVSDTLIVRLTNPFYIDKYEVTTQLYIDYLNAAMDSAQIFYEFEDGDVRTADQGRLLIRLADNLTRIKFQVADSSFWADELYLDHPVSGVTWYGANNYAAFYGLRLPTEAEWEVAARAGRMSQRHMYPWEAFEEIDNSYANFYGSNDPYETSGIRTAPIGSYDGGALGGILTHDAVGPFGTYDQAGNVAEWCSDWFLAEVYSELLAEPGIPIDPQGPDTGDSRVIRGGSWYQYPSELRVTVRQAISPLHTAHWIGFRTAYTIY